MTKIALATAVVIGLINAHAQDFVTNPSKVTAVDSYAVRYLAVMDFNMDGLEDALIGGDNWNTLEKTPLTLLINNGDGSFEIRTSEYIIGAANSCDPVSAVGDFNKDGVNDIAVFDAGNQERGQDPVESGYYGEAAILLLSNGNGKWVVSDALATAYQKINPYGRDQLHLKYALTSDIDSDGDIDIFVESGGGYRNVLSHFYINDGAGNFTADASDDRLTRFMLLSDNFQWRYFTHSLDDLNNDGFPDLVMGQLRRIDNGQEGLSSLVVWNNGKGEFKYSNAVKLPYAAWNDGYTYARKILTYDLNEDKYKDIIICHERGQDASGTEGNTGTYIQFLANNKDGTFTHNTSQHINLSAFVTSATGEYGMNENGSKFTMLKDMNEDGFDDLVIAGAFTYVGENNPLIYLNNGDNFFEQFDYPRITDGLMYTGELSYPMDLNGDGIPDLVNLEIKPGQDGFYGTGDETSEILPTFSVRDYPLVKSVETNNCTVCADGLDLVSTPDLGITHFFFGRIKGGKAYSKKTGEEIAENSFMTFADCEEGFSFSPLSSFSGTAFFYIQGATGQTTAQLVGSRFIARVTVADHRLNAHAGIDKSVCVNEKTTIGQPAIPGFIYSWEPATGLSDSSIANPEFTGPVAGTSNYTLTATRDGCVSEDVATITVRALPDPGENFAGTDWSICSGDKPVLGSTPRDGIAYSWSPATGLSGTDIPSPDFISTSPGTYTFTASATRNDCVISDEVIIVVKTLPQKPQIIQDNSQLTSSVTGSSYEWSRDGIVLTAMTRSIEVTDAGTYRVTITNDVGCKSTSDPLRLVVTATPRDESHGVNVYPIPAGRFLYIQGNASAAAPLRVSLLDQLGRVCHSGDMKEQAHAIDLIDNPDGIYILLIRDSGGSLVQSIRVLKDQVSH